MATVRKAKIATVAVQYRLEARQAEAVRKAAFERAMQRGSSRPDVSEIMREIVEEWIARQSKRPVLPR